MDLAAAEDENPGITSSDGSLQPHIKKNARYTVSFPYIKPNLKEQPQQSMVKIIRKFGTVCYKQFKTQATKSIRQKDDLSLDESKCIITNLAAELDRVIQSKISLMTQKIKNKGAKEEIEETKYFILQWAEDVENTKAKQTDEEEPLSEQWSNRENKFKKAKKILSDWSWRLKETKQNSVCPKNDSEETLKDLHEQWRKGKSSILPVMDWMIWTVLQSGNCEDSVSRQSLRSKQNFINTAGVYISKPVWNWITKAKADVILDPNTANPELVVFNNGKSLRTREFTGDDNWHGYQRKRSKYDGWTCVQGEEGYNSGRHYWEVDVKKKHEWRVGVVKESAPRNGFVTMNTKTGYWNLRLQRTLMALTEPVSKFNLPTPSKIGVYLDVEEGHVSFYDAEKRRHLYTFNTDFDQTEKLYPVFGTIETDRALVILS